MRRRLFLVILAGCGGEPPPVIDPPPIVCPEGMTEHEGRCAWIVPEQPCPAHGRPALGEAACVAVGPGPCTPPFTGDGSEWGCRPELAAECAAGTISLLGSTECLPIGFFDCPLGFALDDGACAEVVAPACTGAARAALGEPGCAPIGDCAAPFPPPDASVVVGPATLAEALAMAASGAVIALDAGTYHEPIAIDRPVTLIGRCAEQVIVETATVPVVRASAPGTITGVTLRGGAGGVVASGSLALREVVIEGASLGGVTALGGAADVRVERSVIRGVRSAADGSRGRGASVEEGAQLALVEVEVDDVREVGAIAVGAGSRLRIEQSVIRGVRPSGAGNGGLALVAIAGGDARVSDASLSDAIGEGILVSGAGSAVMAEGVTVHDIGAGPGNAGVRVESGAELTAVGIAIVRATGAALLADGAGTYAELTGARIAATRPDSTGFSGGAFAAESALISLTRARIEDVVLGVVAVDAEVTVIDSGLTGGPGSIGVFVQGGALTMSASLLTGHEVAGVSIERGGSARIEDTLIQGFPVPGRRNASGIDLHEGSSATVERSAIVDYEGQGVLLRDASSATIAEALIGPIRSGPQVGIGIAASGRSRLDLDRVRVQGVEGLGVVSADGPLAIDRSAVLDTQPLDTVTPAGIVAGGPTVLAGTALVGNAGVGVIIGGGRTRLDGVLIAGTRALSDGGFGHGLIAESATVTVASSSLVANDTVGAFFDASRALVDRTLIMRNGVGVHAQSGSTLIEGRAREPVDLEVVFTSEVLFLDNQTRVGTGQLPIPDPFEGLP